MALMAGAAGDSTSKDMHRIYLLFTCFALSQSFYGMCNHQSLLVACTMQVSAAAAAAKAMVSRAAAISAALETEGRLRQVQAGLRDQEEQANDAVKVCAVYIHCCLCMQRTGAACTRRVVLAGVSSGVPAFACYTLAMTYTLAVSNTAANLDMHLLDHFQHAERAFPTLIHAVIHTGLQVRCVLCQELERDLEASRLAVRALASQRASLANEAGAAETQAAVAQRRIPELETDKKAAAAARVCHTTSHRLQYIPNLDVTSCGIEHACDYSAGVRSCCPVCSCLHHVNGSASRIMSLQIHVCVSVCQCVY